MDSKKYYITASLLFLIFFINGIIEIPSLSVTVDEGDNLNYAIRFIKGHPEKVRPYDDASTMPMMGLNAIPRAFQQLINPSLLKKDGGVSDIISGRYITLFLAGFIGLFTLKWSTELYGREAGLFSLFLFVLCPNVNAYAVLITTDALSCLLSIASAYYFWRLMNKNSWRNIFLFSGTLAIAQLSKQSLTHLLIIFPLIFIAAAIIKKEMPVFNRDNLLKVLMFLLLFLVVINAGFQFYGTGQPLSAYHFKSAAFKSIQNAFSFAGSFPLPFPEPYITGLDLSKNIDEMGAGLPETSSNIYLLGESRKGSGFWYYYFVVLFFKTPIPVIIFSSVLFYFLLRKRKLAFSPEFILVFMMIYFLTYFNFFYNSQVGIRHIIMIFPLLYVLLGKVYEWFFSRKILFAVLLIYSMATFYYYFPNLIPYSNELLLPKRNAYRIIGGANLNYGQSFYFLRKYMDKHPEVIIAPEMPATGKFVIGIDEYLDVDNTGKYAWLRNFKPVDHIAHGFLLFDITEENMKRLMKQ